MVNSEYAEMRSRVAQIPVLEQRLNARLNDIVRANAEIDDLHVQYGKECADVERLKKDSLSVTLIKLFNQYEGKLEKETREMLEKKLQYDKACSMEKAFQEEKASLEERIASLQKEKELVEAERLSREKRIMEAGGSEEAKKYNELKAEEERIFKQLAESDEAIRAADSALNAAQTAIEHLSSAEKWAGWDTWGGGGLITHMAKYNHIDNAEESINMLYARLDVLEKELSDVNIAGIGNFGIDSFTRGVDFWLDNIFTDIKVMNKIEEDAENLGALCNQIYSIEDRLNSVKEEMNGRLAEIEKEKNELIVSLPD